MDGFKWGECVVNGRGKPYRITQACGNGRFRLSGRFEDLGEPRGPKRPTGAVRGASEPGKGALCSLPWSSLSPDADDLSAFREKSPMTV